MVKHDFRFVICVDIEESSSLLEAYQILHEKMTNTKMEWETADEFFIDGEEGQFESLEKVRMSIARDKWVLINKLNKGE